MQKAIDGTYRNRSAKVEPVVKNRLLVGEVEMKKNRMQKLTIGHWRKRKRTTTISNAYSNKPSQGVN